MDVERPSLQPAEILHLAELYKLPGDIVTGKNVRVIGKVASYDIHTNTAVLQDHDITVKVDCSLLGDSLQLTPGGTFQLLGELSLDTPDGGIVLTPKVGRNVDGLDMSLFSKALQLRRDFLAQQQQS